MKKNSDWLFVDESELIIRGIRERDINPNDVDYDNVQLRLWVKPDSQTATVLALRGCEFNRPHPHLAWLR